MGIPAHGVFAIPRNAKFAAAILALPALGFAAWFGATSLLTSERRIAAEQPQADQAETAETLISIAEAQRDTDEDGLKDWEEAIWKTNTEKFDTDGDGTPDGQEVRAGRDPLKKGPDDRLLDPIDTRQSTGAATGDLAGESSNEENATTKLIRAILPDLLPSLTSGQTINQVEIAERIGNSDLIGNPRRILEPARVYTTRDLTPAPQNDLKTILEMFAALDNAVIKYTKAVAQHPSAVLDFFTDPTSPEAKDEFAVYPQAFASLTADITKIPVPRDYQGFILSYLNTLSKIHYAFTQMENFRTDPLSALMAAETIPALQNDFSAANLQVSREAKIMIEERISELTSTNP